MNYCSQCGAPVSLQVPPGDHLPRYVCQTCHTIHYQNPRIVAGCIAEWEDRILLCRRAIEPRRGRWTLPAGFMENGETTQAAAARETWEEAEARVVDLELFGVFNLPHISQVYMMFRSRLEEPRFGAGSESLEVDLFSEAQIPWPELAFPVITEALRLYYDDRSRGSWRTHLGDLVCRPDRSLEIRHY